MKRTFAVVALLLSLTGAAFAQATDADAEQAYLEWAETFNASLDRMTGVISIAGGAVELTVPEGYYYLGTDDTMRVLVDAWGNPEEQSSLGMIFPARFNPTDFEAWGVEVSYERDGYVSDDDAASIDYSSLLADMQAETEIGNQFRIEDGYPAVELLGWAEQPTYDASTHKMYWAKDLRFDGNEVNTLNYNVRALGRRGVLVANFIAQTDQLPEIQAAAPTVMGMIEFTEGNRYSDYQSGDLRASYGLAGLVAGGAVAKKLGLLGVVLVFLKKGWFLVVAAVMAVGGLFRRMRGRENDSA